MKKLLATFFLSLAVTVIVSLPDNAQAQSVGINTAPAASAALDVASQTKGMLVPRMNTAARNAIVSPQKGLMVFDSLVNNFYYYDGTAWTAIGSNSGPTVQLYVTSNAAQQTTSYAYNRYLFYFNNTVSGANTSAFTSGSTYTVPAGMGGLYEFNINMVMTSYNQYTTAIPTPEIEVTRGSTVLYYYGVGVFSNQYQGNSNSGTTAGSPGAPFSFGRGLAQATIPLQAGDVIKVYFRLNSSATSTSFNVAFSTDGSTFLSIVKLN